MPSTKDMCSKMDTQKVGDTYVIDSVCKMGPSTNTTHSVIAGDFNSAYSVKLSSVTSGGPNLPGARPDGKTEMTIEARWTGACKPDQKPGDIIMSNGMKMNIRDMQKVQSWLPGASPKRASFSPFRGCRRCVGCRAGDSATSSLSPRPRRDQPA